MFDLDRWNEVFSTLRQNQLRTLLTACGVFWGMLMLVMMLGFGNGLRQGVTRNMIGFVTNSVYVWAQRTSKPYRGLAPGRSLKYTTDDVEPLRNVPGVAALAPRLQLGGWRDGNTVTHEEKSGGFGVMGDVPELSLVENVKPYSGRFINAGDIREQRKVAVIGQQVRRVLFDDSEEPMGQFISIRGVFFRVIGVFQSQKPGDEGERENSRIHVPLPTLQRAFNLENRVGWFSIAADDGASATQVERSVRRTLQQRHRVHPQDTEAIGSYNAGAKYGRMMRLFNGVEFFIWFVSVTTLLAGALGVSNIMLVSVKERTREFGVRKALGATPLSVVTLVLQEAVLLTALAGYLGLLAGVFGLELSAALATGGGPLGAPGISMGAALIAALVLACLGVISGLAPAVHAARIRPVEALRAE